MIEPPDLKSLDGAAKDALILALIDRINGAATTTDAGLKARAELDENKYPKGVKISDAELAAVCISPHDFHGDWNYAISPNRRKPRRPP